jgi:acyl-CoA synthetase (NDP forming)
VSAALDALFRPRGVAVVGASSDPNKIGGRPLHFLLKGGFPGGVYPINPGAAEVQGVPAFAAIEAIPGPLDLAIIALAAPQVAGAVRAAGARGARAAVVFSAGFGEGGEAGRAMQDALLAAARDAGMRLLGPNSLGLFSPAEGLFATFATALDGAWPKPGGVAIVTQSGALGSYAFAMAEARGLGFSRFVATGNEGDIDLADCIAWLAADPATQVICTAMEAAKDGRRLMAAIAAARAAGKPVIAMKVGATDAGAAAAASHTGSLAGSDAAYDAAFRQAGAVRVRSIEQMVDAAYAASGARPIREGRVAVVTTSGGVGVLLADAASEGGLSLPHLGEAAQRAMQAVVPLAGGANPVDSSAQIIGDLSLYAGLLEAVLAAERFDAVLGYLAHVGRNKAHMGRLRAPLAALRARHPDIAFVLCMLADAELRAGLLREGFLVFEDPTRAIGALALLKRLGEAPPVLPSLPPPRPLPPGPFDEFAAVTLLADAGLPMSPMRVAATADAAVAAAEALGYPVVVKVRSAGIAHKSDIGGVALKLADAAAVRAAFARVTLAARAAMPQARIDGVVVAPMAAPGVEAIIGTSHDPAFGPLVMVGSGGVLVEVLRDVALRVAPVDLPTARAMIAETRLALLLRGVRGAPTADAESLARAIVALSEFAAAAGDTLQSVEVNPVLVGPAGAVGVDALVLPRD